MDTSAPLAFWSYSHEDNENAGGAILDLCRLISHEYSLLTGEQLELFVDTDLAWGDVWRERIDGALIATTFFIPVVTPRFFTREECVRELFDFTRRAKGLGVSELVCPILYVPVADLEEQSSDPAKAEIARAQYADWTALRLTGASSVEHIEAVHKLATRLVEVAGSVATRQVEKEREDDSEGGQVTLGETVHQLRELISGWQDVCETDSVVREQFLAADSLLEERRAKAARRPAGARFLIAKRQVEEYLPLVERRGELDRQMLALANRIGPLLTRTFEVVKEHPEEKPIVDEIWAALESAGDAYVDHSAKNLVLVSEWARRHAHETRGMLTLARACERNERLNNEVGGQIDSWTREYEGLAEVLRPSDEPDFDATA